jgi:hypothetical protein
MRLKMWTLRKRYGIMRLSFYYVVLSEYGFKNGSGGISVLRELK